MPYRIFLNLQFFYFLRQDFCPAEEVVAAVAALSREEGQPYMDYIRLLSKNAMATRVKLADLEHNSDTSRLPSKDQELNKALMNKYAKAKAYLLGEEV